MAKTTPLIFSFSNLRVGFLQAWPHLTPRGTLIKGTARETDLVWKIYLIVLLFFSFSTESTSVSAEEEEAAVQKDLKDESSGNGEVSHHNQSLNFVIHCLHCVSLTRVGEPL